MDRKIVLPSPFKNKPSANNIIAGITDKGIDLKKWIQSCIDRREIIINELAPVKLDSPVSLTGDSRFLDITNLVTPILSNKYYYEIKVLITYDQGVSTQGTVFGWTPTFNGKIYGLTFADANDSSSNNHKPYINSWSATTNPLMPLIPTDPHTVGNTAFVNLFVEPNYNGTIQINAKTPNGVNLTIQSAIMFITQKFKN
jgi:hypothetical protein